MLVNFKIMIKFNKNNIFKNKDNIKMKQKKFFIIQNRYQKIYRIYNKNQKLNKNCKL